MPPRYAYWTIIAGGLPTAFRAAEREDLLPTFTRIREKHPDAEMKWFARGKLWETPDAARRETEARRGGAPGRGQKDRPARDAGRARDRKPDDASRPARGRDWRPGGEHRDPRQPYIDAKKARNQDRRKEKFARKQGADSKTFAGARPSKPPRDAHRDDRFRDRPRDEPFREREKRNAGTDGASRRAWGEHRGGPGAPKHHGGRPQGGRPHEREFRPGGDRERFRGHAPSSTPRRESQRAPNSRNEPHGGPRGPWTADRERGWKPSAPTARGSRPHGQGSRPGGDRERFRDHGQQQKERWNKPRDERRERPREDTAHRERPPRGENTSRGSKPQWKTSPDDRSRDRQREESPRRDRQPHEGWKPGPKAQWNRPREDRLREPHDRPFERRGFERNQGTEPPPRSRPHGPKREPRPTDAPELTPSSRRHDPEPTPPGAPEQGRLVKRPRERS